jgi:hypothetical protein
MILKWSGGTKAIKSMAEYPFESILLLKLFLKNVFCFPKKKERRNDPAMTPTSRMQNQREGDG